MFPLATRTAIVTGGASGIGLAIVQRFLAAGAHVLIADRRASAAETARAVGAEFLQTDVACEDQVAAMFDAARARFGRVDILVNNAGIQPLGVGFDGLTNDLLRRTFDVNVNGVAFGVKHASRALADSGRVINIASFTGLLATPGAAAYAASKFGMSALGLCLAAEEKDSGIRVCNIYPGEVDTPILEHRPQPLTAEQRQKILQPEDVAAAVLFVATLPPRVNIPELIIKPTSQFYL